MLPSQRFCDNPSAEYIDINSNKDMVASGKRPLVLGLQMGPMLEVDFYVSQSPQEETLCYVSSLFVLSLTIHFMNTMLKSRTIK